MSDRLTIPTNAEIAACACGGHTRAQMLRRAAAASARAKASVSRSVRSVAMPAAMARGLPESVPAW